jgi:hypothetical protein
MDTTEFHLLPDVGADGHNLVARADGISIYGPLLEDFVNNVVCAAGDRAAIELCPNNDLWLRRPRFPERISKLSLPVPLMLICNALLQFT